MWMRRSAAALIAVLAVGLAVGTAASAASPEADLAVAAPPVAGEVGHAVDLRYVLRNNGPEAVPPMSWVVDIVAPAGTQIVSAGGGACETVTAGKHLRCRYGFELASGERHALALRLRIGAMPGACGRMTLGYSNDPRPANNVANLRVTVDGKPGSCAAATSPTASPKPSRTRASASPSPSAEATEVIEASGSPAEESLDPVTGSRSEDGGGSSLGSVLVIGGGSVLVALGGLLLWRLLRKDPEDELDEDPTGPIYG